MLAHQITSNELSTVQVVVCSVEIIDPAQCSLKQQPRHQFLWQTTMWGMGVAQHLQAIAQVGLMQKMKTATHYRYGCQ